MSPVASPGLCLDVSNAVFVNTAVVQLWTCNQTPAQQWQFWSDDTLRPASDPSFCLDAMTGVPTGGGSSSSPLQLWSCAGNDRQLWSLQVPSDAMTTGTSVGNSHAGFLYATLYAPMYASGTAVQSAAGVALQYWKLSRVSAASLSSTGAAGSGPTPSPSAAPTQTIITAAFCKGSACAGQQTTPTVCSGQSVVACCPNDPFFSASNGVCNCRDSTMQPVTQQCVVAITYSWTPASWSACAGPCGTNAGTQATPQPQCQGYVDNVPFGSSVDASNCGGAASMPATSRPCTASICPSVVASSSTGTQSGSHVSSASSFSSTLSMPVTVGIAVALVLSL